jgi:predicted glycosyltransferase
MRLLHYTQHVLGVGHLFRSLEIDRALHGHEVHLITGGPAISLDLPKNVTHHAQTPLQMDADFTEIFSSESSLALEEIWEKRTIMLDRLLNELEPDLFLVELFPFGRKRFGRELLPALENIRAGKYGQVRTVCSLRDILVEKDDQKKFEDRVVRQANAYFDAVLVHADPGLIRLEETFSRVSDLRPEIAYTGYVTPKPAPGAGATLRIEEGIDPHEPLVVASAGSGTVGFALLRSVVRGSRKLYPDLPHRLTMFSGPHLEEEKFAELHSLADGAEHIRIHRFSDRFPDWLDAADLSVSMGGYNTTMNLLAASCHGLVLPFARNREQDMRARRLQALGCLTRLHPDDLVPEVMAEKMRTALSAPFPGHEINLDGARSTADHLLQMVRDKGSS